MMQFRTIKRVRPEDLNPNNNLFGGRLLYWIDDDAAVFSVIQLGTTSLVTKYMSEINFMSTSKIGDIVEIGMEVVKFGTSSLTLRCQVRNMITKALVITIDKIVMVCVDDKGRPVAHGKTEIVKAF